MLPHEVTSVFVHDGRTESGSRGSAAFTVSAVRLDFFCHAFYVELVRGRDRKFERTQRLTVARN